MATEDVVGITMVKDEVDIVGETIEHMLTQVDRIIVMDNLSTDGTTQVLREIQLKDPWRLRILKDNEVGYYQAEKMSRLAQLVDAAWVVPFDADERWETVSGEGTVADYLRSRSEAVVEARLINYVPTPEGWNVWRYRDYGMPKVACRPNIPVTIEQGNHAAHYHEPYIGTGLQVRHFPYRSFAQFMSKVRNGYAAYQATNLPTGMGSHWRTWGWTLEHEGEGALREIYNAQIFKHPQGDRYLMRDPYLPLP